MPATVLPADIRNSSFEAKLFDLADDILYRLTPFRQNPPQLRSSRPIPMVKSLNSAISISLNYAMHGEWQEAKPQALANRLGVVTFVERLKSGFSASAYELCTIDPQSRIEQNHRGIFFRVGSGSAAAVHGDLSGTIRQYRPYQLLVSVGFCPT
jgi:hypothetical protein